MVCDFCVDDKNKKKNFCTERKVIFKAKTKVLIMFFQKYGYFLIQNTYVRNLIQIDVS